MPQRSLRRVSKAVSHRAAPAHKSRRRTKLHLVTEDEAAQVYVAKPRTGRPRKLDLEHAAKDPGSELKRIRRRNRIGLAEVERDTRVHLRYLEALEAGATSDGFPGVTYARAFLREYARYLRVDPEPLLAAHPATRPDPEPQHLLSELLPPPEKPASTTNPWMWTVLAAGLLLSVVIWSAGRQPPKETTPYRSTNPPLGAGAIGAMEPGLNAAAPAAENPPAPAAVSGIAIRLAVDGPCWVRATADGTTLFEKTLRAGATQTFDATRRLDLTLGNARAVTLTINGTPYDFGSARIVTLHLQLVGGALKVTRG
jgi:transcriptional regulator with XRE-family HTH domain